MSDLEFFFHYETDVSGKTRFSNLGLLRRDIYTCFGINPDDRTSNLGTMALWPGTMGIMAGIDFLAKFYLGEDTDNSKERFMRYVKSFITEDFQVELYQLRNAMMHSFGLYSIDRKGKVYKFALTTVSDYLLKKISSNGEYCISIENLREKFEKSIIKFKEEYPKMESFQRFDEFFHKYGITKIS